MSPAQTVLALVSLASLLFPASVGVFAEEPEWISCTPENSRYRLEPSGFDNIRISPDSSTNQVEVTIARSPLDEDIFLIGMISERITQCYFDNPQLMGYYVSTDGGLHWVGSDSLPNSKNYAADPLVGIDARGHLFYAYDDHWIHESTDNGVTWTQVLSWDTVSTPGTPDKPDMVIDVNATNNVYIAWDVLRCRVRRCIEIGGDTICNWAYPDTIAFVKTTSDSLAFSPRIGLGGETNSCANVHAANLAVGPGGILYAVWIVGQYDNTWGSWPCGIAFTRSSDGGDHFDPFTTILDSGFALGLRTQLLKPVSTVYANGNPIVVVDTTSGPYHGRVYVVWGDSRRWVQGSPDPDLWMTYSDDSGDTWSVTERGPIRVNDDNPGVRRDQWFPWVDVDPFGGVNIVFYDSRLDAANWETAVWVARSIDGGNNFANFRVSDNIFTPCAYKVKGGAGGFIGDYCGITSNSSWIVPAWMEYREPNAVDPRCGYWHAYTCRIPVSISDTVYVSGGIHNDTTWRWNVILTGDVTIDSGVTLFVKRGTHIIATGFSDDQHAGLNPSLVEINVKGTLQFDWTPGTPPLITADVDSSGAWGGLVFTKGGRLTAGIGATLENPLVGVTIDSTADAPAIRGLTIRKPSAAGFWCESDAVRLVQDTVVDAPQGYGIYLSQSDPSVDSCFVENCEYGIYAWQSSSTIRGCQVKGPGASGIHVDIFYEGESTPDTVQLIDDTVPGTFSTAHLAGGHCQVEHCWFVSGPDAGDTSRSLYGVRLGQDLWLKMRHSVIRDYGRTGYSSYKSNSDLGVFKGEYGNNRISTGAQCDECVVRCVVHTAKTSSDTLKAEMNYWDSVPPPSWWFGGRVDYTPWLTSPPLGKVSSQLAAEPTVVPANFVVGQNYPNPFNPSTVIEFVLPKASRIRVTVYNVLGQVVKALADRVYPMGRHQLAWDGTDNVGRPAASGIYFYRVVTDESAESKKMVLLR